MHDFSFDPRGPYFHAPGGVRFAVQLYTLDNVYVLDPGRVSTEPTPGGFRLRCDGLAWAGQQRPRPGRVEVDVAGEGGAVTWQVRAWHDEPIKAVKLLLRDLPAAALAGGWWKPTSNRGEAQHPSFAQPLLWHYPVGWDWTTPWACAGEGPAVTISARDPQVRAKRLCVQEPPYGGGGPLVEFILEQDARHFGPYFGAPEVRLRQCATLEEVNADFEDHLAFLEEAYDLPRWETRPDLPTWARDAKLVLNLSGQHWTGYVFNTFGQMSEALRFVSRHIPGEQVIAFVLGWEGRYYHSYPNFTPGADLGGPEGFARLREAARETGIHLMPMFGAHGANLTRYPYWEQAVWRNRTNRYVELFNRPDWDADRSGEDDQVFLNPDEDGYRAHLRGQITRLVREHDLEAVYLDTTAAWMNDPRHDMLAGYRKLLAELRAERPGLFVAGEAWWDALLALFPINLSWLGVERHYRQPQLLTRYARAVRHIERGGPGWGSTGVHEWGFRPAHIGPVTPGHLQAYNVVDVTMSTHADDLARVCREAAALGVPTP